MYATRRFQTGRDPVRSGLPFRFLLPTAPRRCDRSCRLFEPDDFPDVHQGRVEVAIRINCETFRLSGSLAMTDALNWPADRGAMAKNNAQLNRQNTIRTRPGLRSPNLFAIADIRCALYIAQSLLTAAPQLRPSQKQVWRPVYRRTEQPIQNPDKSKHHVLHDVSNHLYSNVQRAAARKNKSAMGGKQWSIRSLG